MPKEQRKGSDGGDEGEIRRGTGGIRREEVGAMRGKERWKFR